MPASGWVSVVPPGVRRRRVLAALAALLGVVAACAQPPRTAPPPAEPGVAPLTTPAAGRILPVGSLAEGMVFDPATGLLAVGLRAGPAADQGPYSLALIDGQTLDVVRTVPLPGHLRHLQLAAPGGPLLVADENADALVQVSLPDGGILSTTPVGRFPHDAAEGPGGRVWVAVELGGSVAVVDNGQVVKRFTDGVLQPGGVARVGQDVAVVDVRLNILTKYDPSTLEKVAALNAGAGPTHVISDKQDRAIVADTRGNALLIYSLEPRFVLTQRAPLAGAPYGLAYDDNRNQLIVTLTARNEVVAVDLAGPQPRVVETWPTLAEPNTVAVDSRTGRIFVSSFATGQVQVIDR